MSDWPYPDTHFISQTDGAFTHSSGDAVVEMRSMLGYGSENDSDIFGAEDRQKVMEWHIAHGHHPLPIVRKQDWEKMAAEAGTPPEAEAAPVASFSGSVNVSSGSAIGEVPVSDPGPGEPVEDGYEQMGYRDLQAEARERGLPSGGTHADLIERLRAADS